MKRMKAALSCRKSTQMTVATVWLIVVLTSLPVSEGIRFYPSLASRNNWGLEPFGWHHGHNGLLDVFWGDGLFEDEGLNLVPFHCRSNNKKEPSTRDEGLTREGDNLDRSWDEAVERMKQHQNDRVKYRDELRELEQRRRELERKHYQSLAEQRMEENRLRNIQHLANHKKQDLENKEQLQHHSDKQRPLHNRQSDSETKHEKTTIATIQASGYRPKNIKVYTEGDRLKVHGKHACSCEESCIIREFERVYPLHRNIDTKSITAKIESDGNLKILGDFNDRSHPRIDSKISVSGQLTEEQTGNTSKCSNKPGIKLKTIDQRTGQEYVFDENVSQTNHVDSADDVNIEVVD